MHQIIEEMLDKKTWAVVGATQNPSKYGNKIFKRLQRHGYEVTPINPVYDDVEGVATAASLEDMETPPECVNVVVSPERAKVVVEQTAALGIEYIWFQPGSIDDEVIELAEGKGLKVVYHNCVLVELGRKG